MRNLFLSLCLFFSVVAYGHGSHKVIFQDADEASLDAMLVNPTHTSKAGTSLDWSNPSTWVGNVVPNDGAKVLIPNGSSVRLNVNTSRVNWIRVKGILSAVPTSNVTLYVETLESDFEGQILFGNDASPVTGNLRVVFIDSGPIDVSWDTRMLSRGFLPIGYTEIEGGEVTPWVLTNGANAGAISISLLSTPVGWTVGQRLVLPGISQTSVDDDVVTISSINGTTVTFTSPLSFAHTKTTFRPIPAINLNRKVSFESENVSLLQRGHAMFIHPHNLLLKNAAFKGLGRTNKAVKVTDFPILSNLRGRYSLHIHQAGVNALDNTFTISGCSVEDSPGWGYTNHSSRVVFDNCVSYNVRGAAFVGETGEEVGSFKRCVSVRNGIGAVPAAIDSDRGVADWAFQGHAYWVHGGGISFEDCIATGNESFPYVFMGKPFVIPGKPAVEFLTENLGYPGFTTDPTVKIAQVPPRCYRNVSFGSERGMLIWAMGGNAAFRTNVPDVGKIEDCSFEADSVGISLGYPSYQTFKRCIARSTQATNWQGTGCGNTGVATGIVFDQCEFSNYLVGIVGQTSGDCAIINNTILAATGISLYNTYQVIGRNLNISGNIFPTVPQEVVTWLLAGNYRWSNKKYQNNLPAKIIFVFNAPTHSLYGGFGFGGFGLFFQSYNRLDMPNDVVTLDGKRFYLTEEGLNFSHENSTSLPDWLKDKTTGQIWSTYKLALGGVLLPADVTQPDGVVGLVSTQERTILPKMQIQVDPKKAYQQTNLTSNFFLQVKDASGTLRTSGPCALTDKTWNFPFISIDGYQRGVPVYCDTAVVPPANW